MILWVVEVCQVCLERDIKAMLLLLWLRQRGWYEWEVKDLEKLNIVSADDEGLTPEQVVKDFGLASSVTFQEEGLSLSWFTWL